MVGHQSNDLFSFQGTLRIVDWGNDWLLVQSTTSSFKKVVI